MSRRLFLGTFKAEEDVLNATREFKNNGYEIVDVFTPYAVHGMDEAMGLKPSFLPWASFIFGAIGVAIAVYFQFWTSAIDWPINIGGKPWNSTPAFMPVTFELMVLFAGLGSVATFFVTCRLFPGKTAKTVDIKVTDDHFVLVLLENNALFDPRKAKALCFKHHAIHTEERMEDM